MILLSILSLLLLQPSTCQTDEDDFLATFGYLNQGGGSQDSASLLSNATIIKRSALMEFQRYYGLPETGVVDGATRRAMRDPRCGVPDKNPDDASPVDELDDGKKKNRRRKGKGRSRGKRWVRSPRRWNKRQLTFRFLNYTSDIPESLTRSAFREAMAIWEEVSALEFVEETRSSLQADIEISYITGTHQDKSPFNSLVLAHAFFPRIGWLHMNEQHDWNYNSVRGTDTTFVALHELGHIIGLRHSKLNTIMHASYPGYQNNLRLSDDDIKGVQALYGKNPCYPDNPCANGGACRKQERGRGFACGCTTGWTGTKCTNPSSQSANRKCRAISIPNGHVDPATRLNPNEVARVFCNAGYEIVGSSQFTCTFRGFYSPSTEDTQCRQKILCPALSLTNGEVFPKRGVEVETTVSFSCADGYLLSGAARVKCRGDGTYDHTPPSCELIVEEELDEEEGCPTQFDAMTARTPRDSMIFAFKGARYWIYRRGETGAPRSHWKHSSPISNGFPNVPTHLDTAFSYTDPDSRERFILLVKYPHVYFWDIITTQIARVQDFTATFGITEQVTAAHRWDENTIYFFVPRGYYIYKIREGQLEPTLKLSMDTFVGLPATVTATAAAKAFYSGIFYLFAEEQVYQIRLSDKQVLRNSPYKVTQLWRQGLEGC